MADDKPTFVFQQQKLRTKAELVAHFATLKIQARPSVAEAKQYLQSTKFFGPYDQWGNYIVQVTPDVVKQWPGGKWIVRADFFGNYGICRIGVGY